jgi:hypothetical protein
LIFDAFRDYREIGLYIFDRKEKRGSSTKEVCKQCTTRGKKETQEKM